MTATIISIPLIKLSSISCILELSLIFTMSLLLFKLLTTLSTVSLPPVVCTKNVLSLYCFWNTDS